LGGETPKQFLPLMGKPILFHTLKVFEETPCIDEIYLVLPDLFLEKFGEVILRQLDFKKIRRIIPGGRERQDSVQKGLEALPPEVDLVVIHDGVRPLVTSDLIEKVVEGVRETGAATVGLPLVDTVKKIDEKGYIKETIERKGLWLTQTPQAFLVSLLKEAYWQAYRDGIYATDDCALVERLGKNVKMLMGRRENIKITTKDDLKWAEFFLSQDPV